jgi:hypothetical protein
MSTLASARLKLDRAHEHLDRLHAEAEAWIESHPYKLVDERDPYPVGSPILHRDARHRRVRVTEVTPVPPRWSLLIGDCVHNLRASLDHLALALAQAHTHRLTHEQIESSEFPIFRYQIPADQVRRKIGCVAPPAQAAIQVLQPYHRGDDYPTDPLWLIHDLDRVDKHRRLTLCASVTGGSIGLRKAADDDLSTWTVQHLPFVQVRGRQELQVDAIAVSYTTRLDKAGHEVKMHPEPRFPELEVAFGTGEPAALQPVIPTLTALCDYVRDPVIASLSQFL